MAKLYFRYSAMNSGKSTALMQVAYNYEERGKTVCVIKPSIDTKADNKIQSRVGLERKVDLLIAPEDNFYELLETFINNLGEIDCVLIDEEQFLTRDQINQAFDFAIKENIPVIAYGLRADFSTVGFEGSTRLLEIAHSLEELKTICRCGKKAIFNGRKVNGVFVQTGGQVAIEGKESEEEKTSVYEYESLCGQCYFKKVGEIK